jgi:hypothetical protein
MLWLYLVLLFLSAWFAGFAVGILQSSSLRKSLTVFLFLVPSVAFIGWGAIGQTGLLVEDTNRFGLAFWLLLPLLLAWLAIAIAGFLGGVRRRSATP